MATTTVLLAFTDLKKKSSGGGGFSDGGVHCERRTLSAQPVELGPPPGVAYAGFSAIFPGIAPSVQAINFDPAISVAVEEYFVFEDGSQKLVGSTQVGLNASDTDASLNADAVQICSPYFSNGGVLAFPHKLRYKLVPGYGETVLPTSRVLLHFDVQEFDIPKDQED